MSPAIAPDIIIQLGKAYRASKALFSAVELGVFTVLAQGPQDRATLAQNIRIAERAARDFFDALVSLKLLQCDEDGRYRNTAETDLYLDRRKPTYIGGELDHHNIRGYPHWHSLTAALRTGKPQSVARGGRYFSDLYADQAELEAYTEGMTGGSRMAAKAIAAHPLWRQHRTVIDVGTAQGCLPVEIASVHSHITGGGFDLAPVRSSFESYVEAHGLSHRLQFHAGDFLVDPLPNADVLVIGRVLHNWDLSTKMMLLRKAYDALPPNGVLITYQRLIDDARMADTVALLASLHMLIMTEGGFNFTGADCVGWMLAVGFRDVRVERLTSELSMVFGAK